MRFSPIHYPRMHFSSIVTETPIPKHRNRSNTQFFCVHLPLRYGGLIVRKPPNSGDGQNINIWHQTPNTKRIINNFRVYNIRILLKFHNHQREYNKPAVNFSIKLISSQLKAFTFTHYIIITISSCTLF